MHGQEDTHRNKTQTHHMHEQCPRAFQQRARKTTKAMGDDRRKLDELRRTRLYISLVQREIAPGYLPRRSFA